MVTWNVVATPPVYGDPSEHCSIWYDFVETYCTALISGNGRTELHGTGRLLELLALDELQVLVARHVPAVDSDRPHAFGDEGVEGGIDCIAVCGDVQSVNALLDPIG